MKAKRCIALVLSLLLLTACAAPEPALIEELYGNEASSGKAEISRSIDELWRFDDLVQVKILARSELLQASYLHQMPDATLRQWVLYTDYTLLVEDTIRGPLSPGEVLHAKCMGGESPDGWSYTPLTYNQVYVHPNDRAPALQPGASYILMLQNDATVWEEGNVPAKTMDPREGLYIAVQDGVIEGQRSYFPDFKMPEEKMDAEAYKAMLREHIAVQEAAYREYSLDTLDGLDIPIRDGLVEPEAWQLPPGTEASGARCMTAEAYKALLRAYIAEEEAGFSAFCEQAVEQLPEIAFAGCEAVVASASAFSDAQEEPIFHLTFQAKPGSIPAWALVTVFAPDGTRQELQFTWKLRGAEEAPELPQDRLRLSGVTEAGRSSFFTTVSVVLPPYMEGHNVAANDCLCLLPETEYQVRFDLFSTAFSNTVGGRSLGSQTLTFTTGPLPGASDPSAMP